jgi:TP901 family phage tail tape measure protein
LKQGYEAKEATEIANSALLGANVTGMTSADVAEKLTGALAQFNIEAKNSASVIDKVNEVKLSAS